MNQAYLSLGSNLGDRLSNMRSAVQALANHSNIRFNPASDVSSLYETDPLGGPPDQPKFLNAVVRINTTLSPRELLSAIHTIERQLTRVRTIHHGPRTIDIDILFYDDRVIDEPDLKIPHPSLQERRFVLEPLCEIVANLVHPCLGRTIENLTTQPNVLAQRMIKVNKGSIIY